MILKDAIVFFLGEQIKTTAESYRYVLNAFRDFVGPARDLDLIRADALLEYMQTVYKRPTVKSPATINKHIKTLRTFFNWCVKMEFLESSPAKGLKYRRQDDFIPRQKALPDYLYDTLIDYSKWDARALALMLFLGDTGCRVGGAAGLRWNEIDFEQRMAFVVEKGKPKREVFFGEECLKALLRWREKHPMIEGDYVFSAKGGRIKNGNLAQYFRRTCINAGVGSRGPHSLRHRKGHQLADARVPPPVAARALGDTIEIMMKYYYPDDLERVQNALDDLSYQGEKLSKIRRFGG
jgi:integrase